MSITMSLVNRLDQIFDLDMALTTSATMMENSGSGGGNETAKLISDSVASGQNRQIELPIVAAVGVCTVCMEGFKPREEGNQVTCGHVFHGTCIHKWLSLHNSCPLCRFHIVAAAVQDASVNSF